MVKMPKAMARARARAAPVDKVPRASATVAEVAALAMAIYETPWQLAHI